MEFDPENDRRNENLNLESKKIPSLGLRHVRIRFGLDSDYVWFRIDLGMNVALNPNGVMI